MYWGGAPDIEQLEVVRYTSDQEVKDALLSGELDLVWGAGVLSDSDIVEIRDDPVISERIQVAHGDAVQNAMIILNTGKPPFDDINVRKTAIHAIDKSGLLKRELPLSQSVDNIFPRDAPYCDVELSPRWSYDLEKAVLLSCDGQAMTFAEGGSSGNKNLALGLGLGLGIPLALLAAAAYYLHSKNKTLAKELENTKKIDNAQVA